MDFPLSGKNTSNDDASNRMLRAQTLLWTHVFNHIDSMSLKCAVELGIPQAIHDHGGGSPISLPILLSSLRIPSYRKSHFRRLMQQLEHAGIFGTERKDDEDFYSLTPVSELLVKGNDNSHNTQDGGLSSFVAAILHPVMVNPFRVMSQWFRSEEEHEAAFCTEHGCRIWELTGRNPEFSKLLNEGMESDSRLLMGVLLEKCGDEVFRGVGKLVDVGGGTGLAARAVREAYPEIKCSVLDLAQVVESVGEKDEGGVEFIAGDMFENVPAADAVLLKWVLHDWSDEDCVKILKKCKEAVMGSESKGRGKVIVIDQVMGMINSSRESTQAQIYLDMMMMVLSGGIERDETMWSKIFEEAGFGRYKIASTLDSRSVIELYP